MPTIFPDLAAEILSIKRPSTRDHVTAEQCFFSQCETLVFYRNFVYRNEVRTGGFITGKGK